MLRVILSAFVCAALLCGCAKDEAWKIGEKAPEISVLDLKEQTVKLSQFRGKPVVLRFWATGCKVCVAGMPKLDQYSKSFRERGGVVIAVNMANPKPMVEAFAKGLKLSYPVLLDPALIAAKKYEVKSVPTTFFIDTKGVARKVVVGDIAQDVFAQAISELL